MIDPVVVERMTRNEPDMAYRLRVKTILEWLQPRDTDSILDAGCGRGFYLTFVREVSPARLAGVELDFATICLAKQALGGLDKLTLANANLLALPFPERNFDKVILSEVLEHVEDDIGVLVMLARILKPGGLLAITVPHANYPFWWDPINKTLEVLFGIHIQHGVLAGLWANHVRLYREEQLCAAVAESGLEILEVRRFTHYCFPFIHNIVYGFGKTALEAGVLPEKIASAANRHDVSGNRGGPLNPVNIGLTMFEWFDRRNLPSEPVGRATVNLALLARKPAIGSNDG